MLWLQHKSLPVCYSLKQCSNKVQLQNKLHYYIFIPYATSAIIYKPAV